MSSYESKKVCGRLPDEAVIHRYPLSPLLHLRVVTTTPSHKLKHHCALASPLLYASLLSLDATVSYQRFQSQLALSIDLLIVVTVISGRYSPFSSLLFEIKRVFLCFTPENEFG